MKKIIELTEENEQIIATVCDAALKGTGMQSYRQVERLISLVQNIKDSDELSE